MTRKTYVTTPIYYVNDRPHIGHLYTTTIADVVARFHRLRGDDVFFLTGTDEHAAKVVDSAEAQGISPQECADRNSQAFQDAFTSHRMTHDDFIRTTESRHIEKVERYFQQLLDSGDVYQGEYEGWYDAGQEEYVTESKAKASNYRSEISGKELVRKREKNYFLRLSRYSARLLELLESGEFDVRPEARKNEVIARIRDGLNDVPISRTGAGDWGIHVPGDDEHTIYVWIDALFNYLSTVDTDERRHYWPADVHFIAKDILWFHAVIWPTLLLALREQEGNDWIALPKVVYSHSYWISEGTKMSKSLGNFVDLERLDEIVADFGLDVLRWFLATQGPMGATDSDFAHARLVEVYNADLANTFGNCASRVTNMTNRYFDGRLPAAGPHVEASVDYDKAAEEALAGFEAAMEGCQLDRAADSALALVRQVDGYIEQTRPFQLAKDPERLPEVGTILYHCAEALRIASVLLWPFIPGRVEEFWRRIGRESYIDALADRGRGDLRAWCAWGGLEPGTPLLQGDPLFPRRR